MGKQVNLNTYYYKKTEIDSLLNNKANSSHTHGNITNDGKITNQASKNVVTDSNGKITTEAKPTIPSANATATNIKMNGTQSAGSLTTFAKADHVHPVDTSRAAASHTHDDRYYTETEVNTKLSDYLTTDDASTTYQPKGSYLTSHNPVDTALSSTSTNAVQNKVINTALSGKANSSHTHHDTDIDWNGSALAGMVSPVDMAMYREFNANRLAYLDSDNITIEYSTNGGSTWTAIGTATEKLKLVTTASNFKAGNGSTTDYSKNQVRVTIKMGDVGVNSSIYMTTRKIMLYLCTCGASGTKCQISTSTYKAPTTFTNVGNAVEVSGYSGWNSIPLNVMLGGYANQVGSSSDRIQNLRLTFTQTGGTGNLGIQKIRLFGETAWAVPSTMASEGDLYSYDENQNATFSNKITSSGFVKSGGTSSQFLKADGSVDSNDYIKKSSTSGYVKNDGTVGTPTNTTYSADNSTLQLSSTTFSVKDGGITNAKLADKSSLITEYIVGTQASSTSAWTGKATKITSLETGQVIYYKLPYASTSTAVTLNLTLADNSATGAKEVWFWNGTRMNTQYGVNSVIGLIYNGSQWWAINPSSNNNNDYLRLATRIVNGDENQIPANRIIGGVSDSNGVGKYYIITSGKVLDIRYPILFNNSAINSGGYTDNVYISHTGVPLVNNVSEKTVTSQRQVYIEGTTYSNNKLTVSPNVFVSDDNLTNGYYYLYIGVSYSTTHIRFNAMNQIVYKKTSNGLIPVGQSYNDLTDKPSTFPPSTHTHTKSQITDFPTSMTPTAHTDSNGAYGKATTSVWGHTKLSSATNSTDETMSATPKAVKAAYDLANGKPSLGTTDTTAAKGNHTHTADTINTVNDGSNIIQDYGVTDVQNLLEMLHDDKASYEDLSYYSLDGHSHSYSNITNKPSYTATVTSSTSGAYKIGSTNINGSNVDIYGKDTTYTHPSYTARTGVPTGNATLSHGGTFTVTQPVCDATGHITALNTRTYTLPSDNNTTYTADESTLTKSSANVFSLKDSSNYVKKSNTSGYLKNDGTVGTPTDTTYSTATQSANGLMSSGDKQKVDKSMSIGFGTLAGTTSAFTVSITGVTLTHGTIIACYNAVGGNAANATLKVNSETAKPIYYNASAIPASRFPNKSTALLMYNTSIVSTGCWQMIYSYDSNNTYTAESTSTNIKMNGTQAIGSLSTYARGDHVHPSDTSRVAVSQGTGNSGKFLKVNSSGNVACESVTIPTKTSQLTNDSGFLTSHQSITGKADKTGGVAQVTDANANNYTNIGSLSSGATQQAINNAINTALGGKQASGSYATANHTHSGWTQVLHGTDAGTSWGWILYANEETKIANFTWNGTSTASGTKEAGTITESYRPLNRHVALLSLGTSEFVRIDTDGKVYAKLDTGTTTFSCNTYWRYE